MFVFTKHSLLLQEYESAVCSARCTIYTLHIDLFEKYCGDFFFEFLMKNFRFKVKNFRQNVDFLVPYERVTMVNDTYSDRDLWEMSIFDVNSKL